MEATDLGHPSRPFLAALTLLLITSTAATTLGGQADQPDPPMVQMAQRLAGSYEPIAHDAPADPVEAARYGLTQLDLQGRTATGWTAHAASLHGPVASDEAPEARPLASSVQRVYEAVGAPWTPQVQAQVQAQAAGLPDEVRGPWAHLVATVAQALEEQTTLAKALEHRWGSAEEPGQLWLTRTERDATAARAQHLLQALATFRVHAPTIQSTFADPEGLVVLAGPGDDTHAPAGLYPDPVLSIDVGGNDRYEHSAGGADPTGLLPNGLPRSGNHIALSVVVDLGGDDVYVHDGSVAVVQGAGAVGGLGLLVDVAGDDTYSANFTRTMMGPFQPFGLYYFDGGGQGYGYTGLGHLLDTAGNDTYRMDVTSTHGQSIWAMGQGFGGGGGLGIASDAAGTDAWLAYGHDGAFSLPNFQGLYVQGAGFHGGVGIMADTGGDDDRYEADLYGETTDYYAQGFGAFGGVGIMYDDLGDDAYSAVEEAYDTWIVPLLNCAYGTASAGGAGVFLDAGGHDSYYGHTISDKRGNTMNEGFGGIGAGLGLFVDLWGDDVHVMEVTGAPGSELKGRGEVDPTLFIDNAFLGPGGNLAGIYLDAGGQDTYVGPGTNDDVWGTGADLDLVPGPGGP